MSYAYVVTVTDNVTVQVVPDYRVNITSDAAGATVLFSEYTTTAGTATFSLDDGTYYVHGRKAGYETPDVVTVTINGAADTEAVSVTPIYIAAAEVTAICNGAVLLVGSGLDGVEQVDDFTSDTSLVAQWCRRRYDPARKRALVHWKWPEARKRVAADDAGGDVDTAEHPNYEYAYLIPTGSGLLALRGIVDTADNELPYRRMGPYIHTDYDTDEFYWDFTEDLQVGFSGALTRCIEYELAIDLCGPILKGDKGAQRRVQLIKEYRELALPDARDQAQSEEYDSYNATAPESWADIE